jgi:hypothetical protein
MEMGQTRQQRAHVYMSICATAICGCDWIHDERAGEILSILLIMRRLIISQD